MAARNDTLQPGFVREPIYDAERGRVIGYQDVFCPELALALTKRLLKEMDHGHA
jgi:hypothetical protein